MPQSETVKRSTFSAHLKAREQGRKIAGVITVWPKELGFDRRAARRQGDDGGRRNQPGSTDAARYPGAGGPARARPQGRPALQR